MIDMIKHRLLYTFFLALVAMGATFCLASPARAAFNNNRVMDDGVFDNSTTMDEASIQNFLNSFPNSCLKNYQAPYPNDYFNYGGNVPAARVIKRAADLWGINPQVILATLEKEESLVRGNAGCADWRYNSAMGMGCPDGGGCPSPAYAGFSKQVTKGSWQLKYNKERSYGNTGWGDNDSLTYYGYMTQGNRKRCGSCSNIYYDGWASIDSTSVHMDTGATASLYTYTPHFHGNQNFVALFEAWFGSTWGAGEPPLATYAHPQGALVRQAGDSTVYVISSGKKIPIPSLAVFNSYGYKWDAVKPATQGDIALTGWSSIDFRGGTLVKGSSPTIYVIENGAGGIKKRPIASWEIFVGLGYKLSQVIYANDADLPSQDGLPVSNTLAHPDGSILKSPDSAMIYYLSGGNKYPFSSPAVFLSHGNRWDGYQIATVADESNALGPNLHFRQGTLIKGSYPTIYVANDDEGGVAQKQPIGSQSAFIGLRYYFSEVYTVSDGELPIQTGATIGP